MNKDYFFRVTLELDEIDTTNSPMWRNAVTDSFKEVKHGT